MDFIDYTNKVLTVDYDSNKYSQAAIVQFGRELYKLAKDMKFTVVLKSHKDRFNDLNKAKSWRDIERDFPIFHSNMAKKKVIDVVKNRGE